MNIRFKIKINDREVKYVEKVPSLKEDFILEELLSNTDKISSYSYNEDGQLININNIHKTYDVETQIHVEERERITSSDNFDISKEVA